MDACTKDVTRRLAQPTDQARLLLQQQAAVALSAPWRAEARLDTFICRGSPSAAASTEVARPAGSASHLTPVRPPHSPAPTGAASPPCITACSRQASMRLGMRDEGEGEGGGNWADGRGQRGSGADRKCAEEGPRCIASNRLLGD